MNNDKYIFKKTTEEINKKNKIIDKKKRIELKENESEYGSNYKTSNNRLEFSSLSFKIDREESKNNLNNDMKKDINDKNNIISKNNNQNIQIKINDNIELYNFTHKLYNSEEHFDKLNLFKRKNSSRDNLLNLNFMRKASNINKNISKKTSLSRRDIPKIYRKSLFQNCKKEEENNKDNNGNKRIEPSINSKKNTAYDSKSKDKNNIYAAFFKLKEKNKRPPKTYYIDSVINNTTNNAINTNNTNNTNHVNKINNANNANNTNNANNSKFNSSIINNKNREQSIKSYKTIVNKSFKKNIIFSPQKTIKTVNINKNEEKKEEKEFHIIPKKISGLDIEDKKSQMNLKETQNNEKYSIKKIKWNPKKFLCCLNCKVD